MDHFGLILEPPRIGGRAEPILEDLVQEAYTDPPRDLKKRRFSFVSVIFSRPRSASAGERDLEAVNSVIDTNSEHFSYGFCGFMVVDVVSSVAPPLCQRGGASFGCSQQRHGDLTAGCWLTDGWLMAG